MANKFEAVDNWMAGAALSPVFNPKAADSEFTRLSRLDIGEQMAAISAPGPGLGRA